MPQAQGRRGSTSAAFAIDLRVPVRIADSVQPSDIGPENLPLI